MEICLIGICNLFVVQALKSKDEYSYRVDVARCVQELETGIPLEQIKLSDYPTLTRVSIFDAQEVCNEEYRVEEVQGKLYRFCYRRTVQYGSIWKLDLVLGLPVTETENAQITAKLQMDMQMDVNATGDDVRISYPSFSNFEDLTPVLSGGEL